MTKNTIEFLLRKPRGTQDILPDQQMYWEYVVETAKSFFYGWNFQRIDTPLFEETALFTRGVGEETELVSKEMFELKTRGSTGYALRPEGTAPVARAFIEYGMRSWPQPVKLFYLGPFFRYERPQKGRWRQFHQFGVEVFGSTSAVTDAELMWLTNLLLKRLGLEQFELQINSLGQTEERGAYIKLLKEHYRRNRQKLCQDCKERLVKNPLRLLDCKEEKCQQLAATAPRLLDHLTEESRRHFEGVLGLLDELEVSYVVKPALVRGFDYYTHTVWEFVPKVAKGAVGLPGRPAGQQSTLSAGGRYSGLVKMLGGKDTPGVGFASGIERIIDQLKIEGVELTVADRPQVFIAQLGQRAKREALRLSQILQEARVPFASNLDRDGMQAQLHSADRMGAKWALIIGQKEALDKTVIFRNMESGMQEVIPQDKVVEELKKRLSLTDE